MQSMLSALPNGCASAQSSTKQANHMCTQQESSYVECNEQTPSPYLTSEDDILIFSPHAQSDELSSTAVRMVNSQTLVPSPPVPIPQMKTTGAPWPTPSPRKSSCNWPPVVDSLSSMPATGWNTKPEPRIQSRKNTKRAWNENRQSYGYVDTYPTKRMFSLASQGWEKHPGPREWRQNRRCGCATWMCYAHSELAITNQSYSTTWPSATCREKRK